MARHRMQEYASIVESRGSSVEQSRKGQHAVPRRRRPRYGAGLEDGQGTKGGRKGSDSVTTVAAAGPRAHGDAEAYLQSELPTATGPSVAGTADPDDDLERKSTVGSRDSRRKGGPIQDGGETVAYAQSVHPSGGQGGAGRGGHRARAGGFDGFIQEDEGDEDEATRQMLSPEDDIASMDQTTYFGWRLANMRYTTRRHREDEFRLYTAERAYRQMTAHFG